jgi:hypothetical protein
MKFELKKTELIGNITRKDDEVSTQMITLRIGVVGCPYEDVLAHRVIEYAFPNTTSIADLQINALAYAQEWLDANYSEVV